MMKLKQIFFFFFLIFLFNSIFAQETAIGEWRAHLPYRKCTRVVEAGRLIYCATPYALFNYNRDDNSISRLNKVNGLSDVEISSINYSEDYKTLVVTYVNANIDLITENGIINISDIKRKSIYGNKTIFRATFLGQYVYFSCGFGIVVLDLVRKEIADTYYIGPLGNSIEVNDITYNDTNLYAATSAGIYYARRDNPNLANYAAWQKDTTLNIPNGKYSNITYFAGTLITSLYISGFSGDTLYYNDGTGWSYMDTTTAGAVNVDDYHEIRPSGNHLLICGFNNVYIYNSNLLRTSSIYSYNPGNPMPLSAIQDNEGYNWIADQNLGLVRNQEWSNIFIKPNGPASTSVYSMAMAGSDLWAAPGSLTSALTNTWNVTGPSSFINENWYTLKDFNSKLDSIYDMLYVAIDPSNYRRVFVSSYENGIAEFNNGILGTVYTYKNSGLERPYPSMSNSVWISGISFDQSGNLWAVNSECNSLLKVLKPDGTWESFNVSSVASQAKALKILIDSRNYKWVILFGNGLLVLNDNNTLENHSDDQMKKMTTNIGSGNLPSGSVLSIAEDLDGEIWVGTDKGIAVFYSPENIFTDGNYDAQVITIEQDSTAQHLLEFETVTAIKVDGSNKKWVGTQNAGVFLFSDDGQKEIYHFTVENSPLLSNEINDIAIDGNTGEVFFGTNLGICSFKGTATIGKEKFVNVYAYPNPVPSGFNGMIGIKGLTRNSWIKITDISGTLIYETRSEGGQAVWNGCNFSGVKAKTGVYLVYCINEEGTEKMVTKILIEN
jgi:hypothetical protein